MATQPRHEFVRIPPMRTETMGETATVNLRVPVRILERIDKSAERSGLSRTAYFLSWLPDVYDAEAAAKAPADVA